VITGCASYHYSKVKTGELHGKLIVQWYDYDKFIFVPDQTSPLTFVRHNSTQITPDKMYTDGGSIPRPLWGIRRFSPWGYAPAFIIHDWLFVMHHCKLPGYEAYDLDKTALIMSEVMKTLMEDPEYGGKSKATLYSMYEAVRSSIAEDYWKNGECYIPKNLRMIENEKKKPLLEYSIVFP
jgi:hypothetical protein